MSYKRKDHILLIDNRMVIVYINCKGKTTLKQLCDFIKLMNVESLCGYTSKYRYLSLANFKWRGDHHKNENSLLRAKVKDLFEKQSIQVDDNLSSDLRAVIPEQPDKSKRAFPTGSFLGLFWKHAAKASHKSQRQAADKVASDDFQVVP